MKQNKILTLDKLLYTGVDTNQEINQSSWWWS